MMRLFRRRANDIVYPHQLISAARWNWQGDYHTGLQLVREARERFDEFYGRDQRSRAVAEGRADAEEGYALAALDRWAEAEPLLARAILALTEYTIGDRADPDLVWAHLRLGIVHLRLGRPGPSLAHVENALRLLETADPEEAKLRPARGVALCNRAAVERVLGSREAALASLDAAAACLPGDPVHQASCHIDRARVLHDLHRFPEMEASAKRAVDLLSGIGEASVTTVATYAEAHGMYAHALHAQGRHAETLEIWAHVLEVAGQISEYMETPHSLVEAQIDYANALTESGDRLDEATALLEAAGAKLPPEAESRNAHRLNLYLHAVRAENLEKQGRVHDALAAAERSHESHARYFGDLATVDRNDAMEQITKIRDRLAAAAGTSGRLAE
ncbi:tetratricopeptide repeat protein [Hamadaea sp. NPDC050747]|uniref:tetratricopeptide repeat protein n=1 Tax=Hamadaea sp. NPDC050747 TaxID=3155789 RepID=UPI0033D0E7B1